MFLQGVIFIGKYGCVILYIRPHMKAVLNNSKTIIDIQLFSKIPMTKLSLVSLSEKHEIDILIHKIKKLHRNYKLNEQIMRCVRNILYIYYLQYMFP